jgi:hypothetical protein
MVIPLKQDCFFVQKTDDDRQTRAESKGRRTNLICKILVNFLFYGYSNTCVERSGRIGTAADNCFRGPPIIKWHIFFPLAKRNERESSGIFHSPLLREIRGNQMTYFIFPVKSNKKESSGILHSPC